MQWNREEAGYGRSTTRSTWLACMLALVCFTTARAQEYRYDQWTADSGLPQNIIRGIAQTPDGYLWIATLDGLARFDGVRFTLFNKENTPQITSNRIAGMMQDGRGDLWLATESGGLTRYSHDMFRTLGPKEGVPENSVRGIARGSGDDVWVLAEDSILRWEAERQYFTDATPPQRRIHFNPLLWGSGFWGRDAAGLHIFADGRLIDLPVPPWMAAQSLFAMAMDETGTIWIEGSDGQQAILVAGSRNAERLDPAHPREFSWHDAHGQVWSFHVGFHLERYLGATSALPLNRSFEDREGNLWIGTEGQGLYRIQEQSVLNFSKKQGLSGTNIYPVYQDGQGAMWLGAWPLGLVRIAGGMITNFTPHDGLPSPLVTAVLMDRRGRLWVGTRGGLAISRGGKFVSPPGIHLPDLAFAQAIVEDRGGTIWIGTSNGLALYRNGPGQTLTVADGLATNDVRTIIESHSGDMWIGGYGGLTRVHGSQFTRWTERDGLPSDNIRALYEDPDGVLWIGTYDGGIGRLKDGKLTRYTEKDGLFNDGAFQILEDRRGNLWVSCNRGIYRVKKGDLNAFADGRINRIPSVAYGKSDGMLNAECNGGIWPAGIKTRDGELWFPTQDGVAIVKPATVRINPQPPPVAIEAALVDHAAASFDRGKLSIPPHRQNLEIQYTALSFIHPEEIRFRYRMDGLDTNWIDAGPRRAAYYSHLPSGKYTFHVIARNSDGVWNTAGESLEVTVLAPFYQQWWFTLLEVLTVAVLATAIVRYRLTQLEERRALQQAFSQQLIASQESERQRIAAELHDSLGQRLVVINNLALLALRPRRQAQNQPEANGQEKEVLEEISAETALAIQETREISYNLRPFQLDRLGLTRALQGLTRSVGSASGLMIAAEIENIDDAFPQELRINFYRIVQESLNNVMKHARATKVNVRVTRNAEGVTLTIRDNGAGFEINSRPARSGKTGFGMTGMAERAHLLGGTFRVWSAPEQGTVTTVAIPARERTRG